ncbi:MAG TPA: ABC transporter ATP-binding protein [Thermoanaerobaculia bacterium]
MRPALEVVNVRKTFGATVAVDGITFSVAPGELFGYLGPNGAGKSTTLRIVGGLVRNDEGEVRILGASHREARARRSIGFLPGELKLWGSMRAGDLLDRIARFRPDRPPVLRARLLEVLGVGPDVLAKKVKFASHGTKQKIGIVAAMQHDPDLLLLDEPTLGLDPLVQEAFRRELLAFAARGRAVLFSSHILPEVEAICGRVAILRAGKIVALETVDALRRATVRRLRVRFLENAPGDLAAVPGVTRVAVDDRSAELFVQGDVNPLLRRLAREGVEDLVFPEPELEDIFMTYYRGGDA